MIILGICDSHEAHACVVNDGVLVAAMAEERLSRLKADMGYPRLAIDAVLRLAGVDPREIDVVAFAGAGGTPLQRLYKMNALFSVRDWIDQNKKYWGPRLLENRKLGPFDDFDMFRHLRGGEIEEDPYFPFVDLARNLTPQEYAAVFNKLRRKAVIDHLGVDEGIIRFFRHEDCHKAYGFYSSPYARDPAVVLTIEGGGDDSSATVSTGDESGFKEHWRSNDVQAGRVYRYVTLLLGMKPAQHEYKVMGLAPYGNEYHGRRSLEFFRRLHDVDGIEIRDNKVVPDLYFSLKDALDGERFDGIAWGLQSWLEELLLEWVGNVCREYQTDNVILSGGVAQNIKACKRVLELPEVSRFWVGPISGDGSLGIGAAWLAARTVDPDRHIEGLPTVYLGTSATSGEIAKAVRNKNLQENFVLVAKPDASRVSEWLASGLIVARFSGRMEFGQRALGNRSILADPRRFASVERINQQIKRRDFWMPFTPSMTAAEANRLLVNPKNAYSPFMTMAFDLKPEFKDAIPAAVHPADKTARPQMLRRESNPPYHDLLEAFAARTGMGVLLNTSFNLHGDAIVESPDDAIDTFLKSDLDVLLFDDVAVARGDVGRIDD